MSILLRSFHYIYNVKNFFPNRCEYISQSIKQWSGEIPNTTYNGFVLIEQICF